MRWFLLVSEFNFRDTSMHYRYGDLYRQCLIDDFKENFYVKNKQIGNKTPEKADIFLIGDSYFERSLEGEFISKDLENIFSFNIYDLADVNSSAVDNPLGTFKQLNYVKYKRKILLLETTERFSTERVLNMFITSPKWINLEYDALTSFIYKVFLNREFYIEHNYITYPVLCFKNSLNFKLFKTIDKNIGAFSTEPPMLFYREDVEFSNRIKTPETIDSITNNIEQLKNILSNDYGIILLYVVIPDKYSIYNDWVTGEYKYSGFIPALNKKLADKNIYTVDLYSLFMNFKHSSPDKILYNKSESHFNGTGKALFLETVGNKINEIKKKEGLSWMELDK